jgi:hypothetical protein
LSKFFCELLGVFLHIPLTFQVFFFLLSYFFQFILQLLESFFWNLFGMHISAMLKFFGLKL